MGRHATSPALRAGARSGRRNDKILPPEPPDHALDRCRGGWSIRTASSPAGPTPAGHPKDIAPGNVGERAFNRLERWRGIATSYDEHALYYRAGVVIACIVLSECLVKKGCGRNDRSPGWQQEGLSARVGPSVLVYEVRRHNSRGEPLGWGIQPERCLTRH
ncbi:hypothetical protein EV653_1453 [Kribbella pratensis]|uniref:DDE family transposase n=1 Tax=Kribbella pratensis TaxID=2512112 RepID=A0A4V3GHJ0_9ACTN|nr:hypothetical protein EV653_1453 [Kribbella pratensis]